MMLKSPRIGAALVVLVMAGCSSSSHGSAPTAPPTAKPDTRLIQAYAKTVASVAGKASTLSGTVAACPKRLYLKGGAACQIGAARMASVGSYLLARLAADTSTATAGLTVPPAVSAAVASLEGDARGVVTEQAAFSAHSSAKDVRTLKANVASLEADVTSWGTDGQVGKEVAALHLAPLAAPPAHLRPAKVNVRPVIWIDPGTDGFSNFAVTGKTCHGVDLYSEVKKGAELTIYGSGGGVVGIGRILYSEALNGKCHLVGSVRHVPVEPFYQVQVASDNKVPFKLNELLTETSYTEIGAS